MNIIKKFVYDNVVPMVGSLMKGKNKHVNVIYYHDIVAGEGNGAQQTNVEMFKKQMEYIAEKGYKTITFDDIENGEDISFKDKYVLITFDDGWRSNYSEIFDFMKEKNIKYNIFLAVGEISNNPDYLTWEQIREMHNSGLVGFGAHTYSHVSMKDIGEIDIQKEIDEANEKIFEEVGVYPSDFCYPYGQFTEYSNTFLLENTKYKRIYTSEHDFSYSVGEKIVFGRSSINSAESFKTFVNKLNGKYNAFNTVRGK